MSAVTGESCYFSTAAAAAAAAAAARRGEGEKVIALHFIASCDLE